MPDLLHQFTDWFFIHDSLQKLPRLLQHYRFREDKPKAIKVALLSGSINGLPALADSPRPIFNKYDASLAACSATDRAVIAIVQP
jgi:hypothetical protein